MIIVAAMSTSKSAKVRTLVAATALGLISVLNPVAAIEAQAQSSFGGFTGSDGISVNSLMPEISIPNAQVNYSVGADMSANPQVDRALVRDGGWREAARNQIANDVIAYRAVIAKPSIRAAHLDRSAQDWANHLAATGAFHHGTPGVWNSENIAAGGAPNTIVNRWHNSHGHRVNLQSAHGYGDTPHFGVGVAEHPVWGVVYVLQFAN